MSRTILDQLITLKGTISNDDAAGGYVGEYIESTVGSSQSVGATGNWFDGTSISLTAGDWDVRAFVYISRNGATFSLHQLYCGISSTAGNSVAGLDPARNYFINSFGANVLTFSEETLQVNSHRVSLSATTTYYLKINVGAYSAATPQYRCTLSARRIR